MSWYSTLESFITQWSSEANKHELVYVRSREYVYRTTSSEVRPYRRATRRWRYRQSAEVVKLTPYGGVQYASHSTSLSHERPKREWVGGQKREKVALPDMQIEEVGVWVCNVARKTRRVGETSRYFTIILPPTIVAVAAKSWEKKDRSDQGKIEGVKNV